MPYWPTRSFAGADQQIAAAIGERKRVVKPSAFDLEPPIAGHQSFRKCFGGRGAERSLSSCRALRGPVGAFAYPALRLPRLFSIVIAGLDPAIHAENLPAQSLREASYTGCH